MSSNQTPLSPSEAVNLGAVDGVFYSRHFFPKTCRQGTPEFHREMWARLDDSSKRYLSFLMGRGLAKTTTSRITASKRVAYGLSRTILYLGKSQDHAARSVEWLLKQVQFNHAYRETFGLEQGGKWTGTEVEIVNGLLGIRTRILALGITGSVRGVNVDDYRPDFIIGDDLCDEENSATPEARAKIEELWFGALKESLAPASENPDAKMVLLGTPLNGDDLNMKCSRDPEWCGMKVGILDASEQSTWPERWPTEVVLADKSAAIQRNQLSIWTREKQCELITRETSFFQESNLQYWDVLPEDGLTTVMIIDPVPPKTEDQLRRGIRDEWDWEVLTVMARWKKRVFVLETTKNKGHQPEWTLTEFWRLLDKWKPRMCFVDQVAYQKTLAWILQAAMRQRGRYVQIHEFPDKRKKRDRILDGLTGVIANKELWLGRNMESLREQIASYPNVAHDDEIETVAVGAEALLTNEALMSGDTMTIEQEEQEFEKLDQVRWRACP